MNEIMEDKNNDCKGETKKGKKLLIFEQEKNKKIDKLENISKRTEEENININDIIQKGRNNTDEKEKKKDENKIEKYIKENNQEEENKKIQKLKLNDKKHEVEEELIKINNQIQKNEKDKEIEIEIKKTDGINKNEISKNIYQASLIGNKIGNYKTHYLTPYNRKNIKMEAINKGEKIEQRLLMPTIGNVSVGKSYFSKFIIWN